MSGKGQPNPSKGHPPREGHRWSRGSKKDPQVGECSVCSAPIRKRPGWKTHKIECLLVVLYNHETNARVAQLARALH